MKAFLKAILPRRIRIFYRWWQFCFSKYLSRKAGFRDFKFERAPNSGRKRILFYHINGLSIGGTEKFLQIIAKHLDKELFDVFFMFSSKKSKERTAYLENEGVKLIDFSYESFGIDTPYLVTGMRPSIFDVIKDNKIDLLVTTGPGVPDFPVVNLAGDFPIIHINIFAGINVQPNIKKHICISSELADILKRELSGGKVETVYIQSEGPDAQAVKRGESLRRNLGVGSDSIILGRIGRPDNNIFDPIGILAFEKAVKLHPELHYLIVAPAEKLKELVFQRKIPNVIFIDKIVDESGVWEFYGAIDVLAHFRKDGETMGLNIAEAMLSGRPIITHRSENWNAHLEYLESSFSFVANLNDVEQYSNFMAAFARKGRPWAKEIGLKAKEKAAKLFLIGNNIKRIEAIFDDALSE